MAELTVRETMDFSRRVQGSGIATVSSYKQPYLKYMASPPPLYGSRILI